MGQDYNCGQSGASIEGVEEEGYSYNKPGGIIGSAEEEDYSCDQSGEVIEAQKSNTTAAICLISLLEARTKSVPLTVGCLSWMTNRRTNDAVQRNIGVHVRWGWVFGKIYFSQGPDKMNHSGEGRAAS